MKLGIKTSIHFHWIAIAIRLSVWKHYIQFALKYLFLVYYFCNKYFLKVCKRVVFTGIVLSAKHILHCLKDNIYIPENPADCVPKSVQKKKEQRIQFCTAHEIRANLHWVSFTYANYLQYQNSTFYDQKCGKHASVWWSNSLQVNTHSHSLLCTYTNSVDRKIEQLTLVSGSLIWRRSIGTHTPAIS